MKKRFLSHLFLSLCGVFFLSLATAHAQFLIEFTDGRQMTVPSYEDKGEKVKVYTSSGSFAFRKSDIKNIQTVADEPGTKQTGTEPLDMPARVKRLQAKPAPVLTLDKSVQAQKEKSAQQESGEKLAQQESDDDLTPADQLLASLSQLQVGDVFDFFKGSLYQLRYLIGLLAFGKLLKLFLIGSMR